MSKTVSCPNCHMSMQIPAYPGDFAPRHVCQDECQEPGCYMDAEPGKKYCRRHRTR